MLDIVNVQRTFLKERWEEVDFGKSFFPSLFLKGEGGGIYE